MSAQPVLRLKIGLVMVLGVGLLAVALQGVVRGQLPMGRGGRQRTVVRADQPLLFWSVFAVDVFLGVLCIHTGLTWM